MPRDQIAMRLEIEYDRSMVTAEQHNAIQRIMRRAAAEVVGKGAMLANPNVLSIEAREWSNEQGQDIDMNLDWENTNGKA